jgi:phage terminase large subunit-like protein
VFCGADAAITHDTTAIGWAHRREDGKVMVRARVWSVREAVAHHVFVAGGRLDNEDAEVFVTDSLAARYAVQELAYDPRYFESEASALSDAGLVVASLEQASKPMADAWQLFFKAMEEGSIVHDGDPVLAAHVAAATGRQTERGWKVSKLDAARPIDALVAVVMAHYRAVVGGAVEAWTEIW